MPEKRFQVSSPGWIRFPPVEKFTFCFFRIGFRAFDRPDELLGARPPALIVEGASEFCEGAFPVAFLQVIIPQKNPQLAVIRGEGYPALQERKSLAVITPANQQLRKFAYNRNAGRIASVMFREGSSKPRIVAPLAVQVFETDKRCNIRGVGQSETFEV